VACFWFVERAFAL